MAEPQNVGLPQRRVSDGTRRRTNAQIAIEVDGAAGEILELRVVCDAQRRPGVAHRLSAAVWMVCLVEHEPIDVDNRHNVQRNAVEHAGDVSIVPIESAQLLDSKQDGRERCDIPGV